MDLSLGSLGDKLQHHLRKKVVMVRVPWRMEDTASERVIPSSWEGYKPRLEDG